MNKSNNDKTTNPTGGNPGHSHKKSFGDLILDFFKAKTGINPKEYKRKVVIWLIIVVVLVIVIKIDFLIVRINWDFLHNPDKNLTENGRHESNHFSDFKDEKWEKHLGTLYATFGDLNHVMILPETSVALIKFNESLLEKKEVEFTFKPLSEIFANVVISVGNLYEIVIGDNNYETVSVKARLGHNEEWMFIPGEKSGESTQDVTGGIRKGGDVVVKINTEYRSDGNYSINLEIKYKPTEPIKAGDQWFHERYVFTPPFQDYAPLDISVGLINPNYQSGIAAKFISFKIEK